MVSHRAAALLLIATVTGACAARPGPDPAAPGGRPGNLTLRVKAPDGGSARRVSLEDYVRAAVLSELTPAPDERAAAGPLFEIQAIVARTFALAHLGRHRREGYDLCSTTHCQLYEPGRLRTSPWAAAATEAARRTAGRVLWFDRTPAIALFHADCGGHTSRAEAVWGGRGHPYLAAVRDGGPAARAHARWDFEVPAAKLATALNADPRTAIGRDLTAITVVERDEGGRAALVLLRGSREPIVRGEELRSVLTRAFGLRSIRSTRFEIRRHGSTFRFSGEGFGHGVGLCQAGARARVLAGARPAEVLATYFPGTRLGTRRQGSIMARSLQCLHMWAFC